VRLSLLLLFTGVTAFWAVAASLGIALSDPADNQVVGYSATAAGLCLVPSALTLIWALWDMGKSPEEQRLVVLGGTGVRMFVVLGVALLLHMTVPYFGQQNFWLWVLIFYLFTLALEMGLVLRQLARRDAQAQGTRAADSPTRSV
jgi:hypothetical protein